MIYSLYLVSFFSRHLLRVWAILVWFNIKVLGLLPLFLSGTLFLPVTETTAWVSIFQPRMDLVQFSNRIEQFLFAKHTSYIKCINYLRSLYVIIHLIQLPRQFNHLISLYKYINTSTFNTLLFQKSKHFRYIYFKIHKIRIFTKISSIYTTHWKKTLNTFFIKPF